MNKLFNAVFSLRYVAVFAIIAPFFGAVLMVLLGVQNTIEAYMLYFGLAESEGALDGGEAAMVTLVASIDHFLFATILMIFGIGLYALFFRGGSKNSNQDDGNGEGRKSPSWKQIKNMGGMDEMLLKVIIMLLAVSFLEFSLGAGIETMTWTVLIVPLSIIALAIALKWMSEPEEIRKEEEIESEE